MMQNKNSHIFRDLVKAIRDVAKPTLIILFGSQARGNANENSDIDLLLVEHKNDWHSSSRRREIGRIRRALPRIDYPIDLLLFTPSEIEHWRTSQNHLIAEALEHGEVLYEQS